MKYVKFMETFNSIVLFSFSRLHFQTQVARLRCLESKAFRFQIFNLQTKHIRSQSKGKEISSPTSLYINLSGLRSSHQNINFILHISVKALSSAPSKPLSIFFLFLHLFTGRLWLSPIGGSSSQLCSLC